MKRNIAIGLRWIITGLFISAIATSILSSAAYGLLVFGIGMTSVGTIFALVSYLHGDGENPE